MIFSEDDPILMIMPAEPFPKLYLPVNDIEKFCYFIRFINTIWIVWRNRLGQAVRQNEIHLITIFCKITKTSGLFFFCRSGLTLPPLQIFNTEQPVFAGHSQIFFIEFSIRMIPAAIQNFVNNKETCSAIEGKNGLSAQLEHISAHQMEYIIRQLLRFPPMEIDNRKLPAVIAVIVFMVPEHKAERRIQRLKPFQRILLFFQFPLPFVLINQRKRFFYGPDSAEISCNQHKIIPRHVILFRKVFITETMKIAMCISRNVYHGWNSFHWVVWQDSNPPPDAPRVWGRGLFHCVHFQKYIDTCVDFNTFFYWFKHTEHIILYFDSEEDPERSGRQKYCRIQNYNMI